MGEFKQIGFMEAAMAIPETKYAEVVFDKEGYAVGVIWQIDSYKSGDEFGTGWRVKLIKSGLSPAYDTDICISRDHALNWFAVQGIV